MQGKIIWERLREIWLKQSRQNKIFLQLYVIVLIGLLLWPEGNDYTMTVNDPAKAVKESSLPVKKTWEVTGLKAAQSSAELRDPFRLDHPHATDVQKTPVASSPTLPAPPPTPIGTEISAPTTSALPQYSLTGIASSENGRLALVSDGQQTFTLAVGDKLAQKTVTAIGDDYITWQEDGNTEKLMLGDNANSKK